MNTHQLNEALDALEKNIARNIEECYNKYFANVKETINSLIASSTSHTTEIANVLKNEVFELKMKIERAEIEKIETTIDKVVEKETAGNASSNKYLMMKPISELKEKDEDPWLQNLPELRNLQSIYQSNFVTIEVFRSEMVQNMSLHETYTEDSTSAYKTKTMKRKSDKVTTEFEALPHNHQSQNSSNRPKNRAKIIGLRDINNRFVYSCDGCSYKSFEGWRAFDHLDLMHHELDRLGIPNRDEWKCSECNYSAKTSNILHRHENNAHGQSNLLQCPNCLELFNSWNLMKKHYLSNCCYSGMADSLFLIS